MAVNTDIYLSDDFPIHSDLFRLNAVTPVCWELGEIALQSRNDAETCRKKLYRWSPVCDVHKKLQAALKRLEIYQRESRLRISCIP
jgi:hypothetical protein